MLLDYFCEFVLENINYLELYLVDTMELLLFQDLLTICIFESHIDINPLKTYILNNHNGEYFINFITEYIIGKVRNEYNEFYINDNIELEDYLIQTLEESYMDNNMKNYIYEYFMDNNDDMDINIDNLSLS
jgi:hypothetical protein